MLSGYNNTKYTRILISTTSKHRSQAYWCPRIWLAAIIPALLRATEHPCPVHGVTFLLISTKDKQKQEKKRIFTFLNDLF
ncbi:hypothetical protein BC792_105168 [Sphingobacterium allocomposti]|uniref:Uncharacterized protein n=1 Tax=Sphingobacterium allocomposti TaxID=415956 RepID=A0A5S5DLS6_9SPHI|nr:hypothetical protein BC792_105168 [Sphingobacterium composti Yoo et al. 2007 non Ten et al. 2007]